ncbi:MAG: hypothetical protein ACXVXJ_09655 [Mycobacteriaceae bacterium]
MTYAHIMDTIGRPRSPAPWTSHALRNAVAQGMAGKSGDISQVAIWVGTNCHL